MTDLTGGISGEFKVSEITTNLILVEMKNLNASNALVAKGKADDKKG